MKREGEKLGSSHFRLPESILILEAATEAERGKIASEEALVIAERDMFGGIFCQSSFDWNFILDWKPDLIVRESSEYAGLVAAQRHGVKSVRVSVMACEFYEPYLKIVSGAADLLRRWRQTNSNRSQFCPSQPLSGSTELPPLGKSSGSVGCCQTNANRSLNGQVA